MATPTRTNRAAGEDNPSVEWHNIAGAARTDAEQARIEAAMELAETTLVTASSADRPVHRSTNLVRDVLTNGFAFSRVALMWHRVLTDTDAFARSRASDATTCRFDPDATRAWLTGLTLAGDETVAASLHIGDDFDIYGFDKWEKISNLLAQAQKADVFGIPDHAVDVLHLAGERGYVDRHRVTLNTPQHAVLCSDDVDTEDLIGDRCGVDAAVHVLGQVARAADRLLDQRAVLADVAWPTPTQQHTQTAPTSQPSSSNAFPPLATVNSDATALTQVTPAAPPATTRQHR